MSPVTPTNSAPAGDALRGRKTLITGGGTGFGLAIAKGFAAAGADVAVCGRRAGKLASAVARIAREGASGDVFSTTADVSDSASVDALIETIVHRFGRIDILVNNAAVLIAGALDEIEPEEIDAVLGANLRGPLLVTRAALPHMKRHDYGRILNVTSGLGWKAIAGYTAYAASKAGLNAFTRTLAAELAGWNILVNAIDPGVAKTELNPTGRDEPEKVVQGALRLASLPAGGPSGMIFKNDGVTEAV